MRTALTIAGSDSIGGAGAQADIKAMAAVGVHCASVITAVTAQNTREVSAVHAIPADIVSAQLDAVLSDMDIKAAKTGMLYSPEIIRTVADELADEEFPLVVDPVMVATVGDPLYSGEYVKAIKKELLPVCSLITPNKAEAEALVGFKIRNEDDARYACEIIGKDGTCVLLKGGHFDSKTVTDYIYLSSRVTEIKNPRVRGNAGHGSGCVLSSFITANLASGLDLVTSIQEARKMIQKSIEDQYIIGKGVPVVSTKVTLTRKEDGDMVNILKDLDGAISKICKSMPFDLIPKEGMNIAYATRSPKGPEDIAGSDKRIFNRNNKTVNGGNAKFGAAEHLSYVLLEVMKTNPEMRSVAVFAGDSALPKDLQKGGFTVSVVKGTIKDDSVAASIRSALSGCKKFPDALIFNGKTDTVYMFGKGPREIVNKMEKTIW